LESLLEVSLEESLEPSAAPPSPEPLALLERFEELEPYPSEYQPPPLRMKAAAEISRCTWELQTWQRSRGSSVIGWTTSKR